ncbi:MAG TPA: DUF4097 family beta strand repeat-containing protein [Thermoanaerobaculia bacterium]
MLLAAGCVVGERHSATIQRRWPASSIRTIEVVGVNGNLSVEAGTPDEVSLVAHVRSVGVNPSNRAENQGFFETELNGDTLHIGQKSDRVRVHFPFIVRSRLTIDYALRVPPAVALDLKMVNGRITSRGVDGAGEFTTVNGPIDIETGGTNEMEARTVNGSVHARFLRDFRGARLKTVNGRVEATLPPSASFTCDLSQVNGDFEASFPLSIHSHPGSRRVSGQVNGGQFELQITTVNGDVEVHNVPPPPPQPPKPAPPVS